jgi:pyroglutamyl-peptidase
MTSPTLPLILLTGFDPFDGEAINPSWELARALSGETLREAGAQAQVHALRLPCAFGQAADVLHIALRELQPAMVLSIGQAGGRCDLSMERVAINLDDARIPDNRGAQPVDQPIATDGPAAYFSTLPIKAMVAAVRAAGVPASVSHTAGTFVCNHAFYALQHALRDSTVCSGFMHIPYLPEQAARHPGSASLPLSTLIEGTRVALHTAWQHRHQPDLAVSEGQTH